MEMVGFTGTQNGMTRAQMRCLGDWLSGKEGWLHHGDCVGADRQAHEIAKATGWLLAVHPPINPIKRAFCEGFDRTYPERDYIARNHDIVDETRELIATPKGPEETRSGTWSTVRYARKRLRMITIIWPNGSLEFCP